MGLEDQLQSLVPDTIKDCIRANIRVWMITGDKLETARNIGLACNLIDPDMQPVFKAEYSIERYHYYYCCLNYLYLISTSTSIVASFSSCIDLFNKTRLIEVTGAWASLSRNKDELEKLFQIFDYDKDGVMNKQEITFAMDSLR